MPVQVVKCVEAKARTTHFYTGIPNHAHDCERQEVPTWAEFEGTAAGVRRLIAEAASRDGRMASLDGNLAAVAERLGKLGEKLDDFGWLDQEFRRLAVDHIARIDAETGKRLRGTEDLMHRAEETVAQADKVMQAAEAIKTATDAARAAADAANTAAQEALRLSRETARKAEVERQTIAALKAAAEAARIAADAAKTSAQEALNQSRQTAEHAANEAQAIEQRMREYLATADRQMARACQAAEKAGQERLAGEQMVRVGVDSVRAASEAAAATAQESLCSVNEVRLTAESEIKGLRETMIKQAESVAAAQSRLDEAVRQYEYLHTRGGFWARLKWIFLGETRRVPGTTEPVVGKA
jgi:hypothetical protein